MTTFAKTSGNGKNLSVRPALLLVSALLYSHGTAQASEIIDLTEFSLEALGDVVITSVSKKKEKKSSAAAAIYVLTGDEIRAHGVRSLPDALRLIPGLTVAKSGASDWAISARGFNSFLADKMEVVMDGRSLYTPLLSGVFWDAQSTFIDDIERIEVIRGPGASVWGANAVNGVINIVTRSSKDTSGTVVNTGVGTETKSHLSARHGGKLGEKGFYRAYVQSSDYDETKSLSGGGANDDWDYKQAGFRTDFQLDNSADLTVQGDLYDSNTSSNDSTGEISGFNLLGNWNKTLSNGSNLSTRVVYDHIERLMPGQFDEDRDQYEIELVHNFQWGTQHDIVWGAAYRLSEDVLKTIPGGGISFDPESESLQTLSAFIQDQYSLTDTLELTFGTKVEENDFTGTEVQPTIRLAWSPDPLHTWWGALSRAVRTPNRLDRDSAIFGFRGSDEFDSEVAISAETGFRFPLNKSTTGDIAVFYTEYSELRAIARNGQSFRAENLGEGESWGIEASTLWVPNHRANILFAYRYLSVDLDFPASSTSGQLNTDPDHQAFVRGSYKVNDKLLLSSMLRYVDKLVDPDSRGAGATPSNSTVPAYKELNMGVIYQYSPTIEWSLHAENLLHSSHREFGNDVAIERSAYTQIKWRF